MIDAAPRYLPDMFSELVPAQFCLEFLSDFPEMLLTFSQAFDDEIEFRVIEIRIRQGAYLPGEPFMASHGWTRVPVLENKIQAAYVQFTQLQSDSLSLTPAQTRGINIRSSNQ